MNEIFHPKKELALNFSSYYIYDAGNGPVYMKQELTMNGQVTRRYFEEKARRLGLRVYTNPGAIWMQPYIRDREAEREFEQSGDSRVVASLFDDAFSS